MSRKGCRYLTIFGLIVLVAAAPACGAGQRPTEVPAIENQVATAVAQTLEAAPSPTVPQIADAPTDTPGPQPTDVPTHTPEPQPTDVPTDTPEPQPTDSSTLTPEPQPTEPPATPCGPPPGWAIYAIQRGENLFRIAQRYGMSAEELQRANCLPSADKIEAGQLLYVPYLIPTPTPTDIPMTGGVGLTDLKEELYFGPAGGDGAFCISPPADVELPALGGGARYYYTGHMCLWGFPLGESVDVELYDPAGQLVASRSFVIDDERSGVGVKQILLWFPGLPSGVWRVTAASPSAELDDRLLVSPPEYPVIGAVPATGSYVFDGDRWLFCSQNAYVAGDQVVILGAGLPPHHSLPLGIYYHETLDQYVGSVLSRLVHSQAVTTDSQGRFEARLPIEPSDPAGVYYPIVMVDPEYEPSVVGTLSPLGAIACFVTTN